MAKQFPLRKLFVLMSTISMCSFSQHSFAGAFQLFEQDGASIGNYHAGLAAGAFDASTNVYNSAGLVRIHNQEFVFGVDPIATNFKFRGTVATNTYGFGGLGPQTAVAQGGNFAVVPDVSYAAPITDNLVFGLSVVSPFGLKTDYNTSTDARYGATDTSLQVIDLAPSLGFAFNDKFSVGAGLDIDYAKAEFDLMGGSPELNLLLGNDYDTNATNSGNATGFGYHLGALYQFTPETRIGVTYHSKVVEQFKGTSRFEGPLAQFSAADLATLGLALVPSTDQLRTKLTLPASTSLGLFHSINQTWDVMGTITYVQWNVFNQIVLQNASGLVPLNPDGTAPTNLTVTVPQNYHNSWNYAVGANYHANEKIMLRTGLGYDQSPSNNQTRNLQLPDSDRVAVAMGAHYQATKTIGLDFSWAHVFVIPTRINNITQVVGAQTTITNGNVQASADVYGIQMTWDIV